ncbi:MAG: DUF4293 domain-containing protein [Prevotella sp.]|nr:DUF4293 domain-containing protein [Prevotella sp.]
MIQRIQTIYLLVAFVFMGLFAFVAPTLPLIVGGVLAALVSLGTIFLYKKRPKQALFCRCLCGLGVVNLILLAVYHSGEVPSSTLVWSVGYTLGATFCWFLASKAILKDEKLVRSLDRIR